MSAPARWRAGTAASGGFQLVPAAGGGLTAHGPLTFATASAARQVGRRMIAAAKQDLQIGCGAISASDSAGLAVLIDWLAAARAAGRRLRYLDLTPGLAALGRISDVEELLARGV